MQDMVWRLNMSRSLHKGNTCFVEMCEVRLSFCWNLDFQTSVLVTFVYIYIFWIFPDHLSNSSLFLNKEKCNKLLKHAGVQIHSVVISVHGNKGLWYANPLSHIYIDQTSRHLSPFYQWRITVPQSHACSPGTNQTHSPDPGYCEPIKACYARVIFLLIILQSSSVIHGPIPISGFKLS